MKEEQVSLVTGVSQVCLAISKNGNLTAIEAIRALAEYQLSLLLPRLGVSKVDDSLMKRLEGDFYQAPSLETMLTLQLINIIQQIDAEGREK